MNEKTRSHQNIATLNNEVFFESVENIVINSNQGVLITLTDHGNKTPIKNCLQGVRCFDDATQNESNVSMGKDTITESEMNKKILEQFQIKTQLEKDDLQNETNFITKKNYNFSKTETIKNLQNIQKKEEKLNMYIESLNTAENEFKTNKKSEIDKIAKIVEEVIKEKPSFFDKKLDQSKLKNLIKKNKKTFKSRGHDLFNVNFGKHG